MVIPQIRRLLGASPFIPFALQLADGRVLDVATPDAAWVTPNSQLFYWHAEDQSAEFLNPLLIQGVRGPSLAES